MRERSSIFWVIFEELCLYTEPAVDDTPRHNTTEYILLKYCVYVKLCATNMCWVVYRPIYNSFFFSGIPFINFILHHPARILRGPTSLFVCYVVQRSAGPNALSANKCTWSPCENSMTCGRNEPPHLTTQDPYSTIYNRPSFFSSIRLLSFSRTFHNNYYYERLKKMHANVSACMPYMHFAQLCFSDLFPFWQTTTVDYRFFSFGCKLYANLGSTCFCKFTSQLQNRFRPINTLFTNYWSSDSGILEQKMQIQRPGLKFTRIQNSPRC